MATSIQQNRFEGTTASTSNSAQGSGDSLTQITSGPAALVQNMIFEIMSLYGKIIRMQSEQKQNESIAQIQTGKAQARATQTGAKKMGDALINGSYAIMAGAGLGIASYIGSTAYDSLSSTGAAAQEAELSKTVKPMSEVDQMLAGPIQKPEGVGEEIEMNELNQANRMPPSMTEPVKTRFNELKEGNFANARNDDTTKEALGHLKSYGSTEGGVSSNEEGFKWDDWKNQFNQKLDRLTTNLNALASTRLRTSQLVSLAKDVGSQGGSAISSYFQGVGTAEKGEQDKIATINGTVSQVAGGAAGDFGNNMIKAADAMNQEVQVLAAIHQSNNVRG